MANFEYGLKFSKLTTDEQTTRRKFQERFLAATKKLRQQFSSFQPYLKKNKKY